ncbi:MAG: NACHT domain-containing protein [Pseudomonadota bacterium]
MKTIEQIKNHQLAILLESMHYTPAIPLSVCHSLNDITTGPDEPATQALSQFLVSQNSVLLLLGNAGSGKTLLFQQLAFHCWQKPEQYQTSLAKPWLPLFLSLAHWKGSINELISEYLTASVGLTQNEIATLQQTHSCVLILDAYDLSQRYDSLWPKDKEADQQWQISHTLVNSRSEYFIEHEAYLKYFIPEHTADNLTISLYLRPLPDNHSSYLSDQQSGIKKLAQNPLFLSFLQKYLVKYPQGLSKANEAYQFLFQEWFQYQQCRLKKIGLLNAYQGDYIEHCWVYVRAAALKLKESLSNTINFDDHSPYEQSVIMQWERFFSLQNIQTRLVQQACPWLLIGKNQLSLYHHDIISYFVNLTDYNLEKYLHLPFVQGDEGIENISERLQQEKFDAMTHLVNITLGDISEQDYFRLIYLSKYQESFARPAANAISILNWAKIPFSGMNLSSINIPHADLSGAICDHTDFSNANLTGVNFQQAWLRYSNFQNSNMLNINYGEQAYLEHPGKISNMILSADGELLAATVIGERNVYIWQWGNSRLVHTLIDTTTEDPTDLAVDSMQFSPDRNFFAIGAAQRALTLWKLKISKLDIIYLEEKQNYQEIAAAWWKAESRNSIDILLMCTANGLWYICGIRKLSPAMMDSIYRGGDEFWLELDKYKPDLVRKDSLLENKLKTIAQLKLTKEENAELLDQVLVYLGRNSIEAATKVYLEELCYPHEINFSSDNKFLLAATDKGAMLWKLATTKLIYCFKQHTEKVLYARFSPDSQLLIAGCDDHKIRFWDVVTKKLIKVYSAASAAILKVEFCPLKPNLFLSTDKSNTVLIWNSISSQVIYRKSVNSGAYDAHFSPDGLTLAIYSDKEVEIVSTSNWVIKSFFNTDYLIQQIQYDSLSSRLATRGENIIELWDLHTKQVVQRFTEHNDKISKMHFNPQGSSIASASWDSTARLWHLKPYKTYENELTPVTTPPLSRIANNTLSANENNDISTFANINNIICSSTHYDENVTLLAIGTSDHIARIWDQRNKKCLRELIGHTDKITSLQFSPSGKLIATGSIDHTIRIWQVLTGELIYLLQGHQEAISHIQFSPDGSLLASGSKDKTVRLWQLATGAPVGIIQNSLGNVNCLQFSSCGKLLASGGEDKIVRIWNIEDKEDEIELRGYIYKIRSLTFYADNTLLTLTEDGATKLWRRVRINHLIEWHLIQSSTANLYLAGTSIANVKCLSVANRKLLEQRGATAIKKWHGNKDNLDIAIIANRIQKFVNHGHSRDYYYALQNYHARSNTEDINKLKRASLKKIFDTCIEQYPAKNLLSPYAVLLLNSDESSTLSAIEYLILIAPADDYSKRYFLKIAELLALIQIKYAANSHSNMTVNFILGLDETADNERGNFIGTKVDLIRFILPNRLQDAVYVTGSELGYELYQNNLTDNQSIPHDSVSKPKENTFYTDSINQKLKRQYSTKEFSQLKTQFLKPIPIELSSTNLVVIKNDEIYFDSYPIQLNKQKEKRNEPQKNTNEFLNILLDRVDTPIEDNTLDVLKLEDIFTHKILPKHILIVGRAGVGKTTLCQYISYQWARNRLWHNKFESIFWIDLKRLPPQPLQNHVTLTDLLITGCLGVNSNYQDLNHYIKTHANKILILLDGYDELDTHSLYRSVIDGILGNTQFHIIITSQPCNLTDKSFDLKLEQIGLINSDIHTLVNAFFPAASDTASDILDFLEKSSQFATLARVPVHLELICYAWPVINKIYTTQSQLNLTLLYQAMVDKTLSESTQLIILCLERIAFISLLQNQIPIKCELIENIISEVNHLNPGQIPLKLSDFDTQRLLIVDRAYEQADKQYYFVHKSFHDYFAARFIVNAIITSNSLLNINTDKNQQILLEDFVANYKYHDNYAAVFWFITGILSQQTNKSFLNIFLNTINQEPLDITGIYHVILVMRCLDEALYNSSFEQIDCGDDLLNSLNQCLEQYFSLPQELGILLLSYLKISPHVLKHSNIKNILLTSLMHENKYGENKSTIVYKALTAIKALKLNHDDVIMFLLAVLDDTKYKYVLSKIEAITALGDLCPVHYKDKVIHKLETLLQVERETDIKDTTKSYEGLTKRIFGSGEKQLYKLVAMSMAQDQVTIRSSIADTFKKLKVKDNIDIKSRIDELLKVLFESDNRTLKSTTQTLKVIITENPLYQEYVIQHILRILISYKYSQANSRDINQVFQKMERAIDTLSFFKIRRPDIIQKILALLYKTNWEDLVGNDGMLHSAAQKLRTKAAICLADLGDNDEEVIDVLFTLMIDEQNISAAETLFNLNKPTSIFVNALLMMLRFPNNTYEALKITANILGELGLREYRIIDTLSDGLDDTVSKVYSAQTLAKLKPQDDITIHKIVARLEAVDEKINKDITIELIGCFSVANKYVLEALCVIVNKTPADNWEKARQTLTTQILIKLFGFDYLILNNILTINQLLSIFSNKDDSYLRYQIINKQDLENNILDQCELTHQVRLPLIKGIIALIRENTQKIEFICNALLRLKQGYQVELEKEFLNVFVSTNSNTNDFKSIAFGTKLLLKLNIISNSWKEYLLDFFAKKYEGPRHYIYSSSYQEQATREAQRAIIHFMGQFDWSTALPLTIYFHHEIKLFEERNEIFASTPSIHLLNGYLITEDTALLMRWQKEHIPISIVDNNLHLHEKGQCYTSAISDQLLSYLGKEAFTLLMEQSSISTFSCRFFQPTASTQSSIIINQKSPSTLLIHNNDEKKSANNSKLR